MLKQEIVLKTQGNDKHTSGFFLNSIDIADLTNSKGLL
jgi:hypothetical protein